MVQDLWVKDLVLVEEWGRVAVADAGEEIAPVPVPAVTACVQLVVLWLFIR
jgi:hypothetical protein